jgi:agmatinase
MSDRTYAGIPDEFHELDRAEVVLIPVPYDGTSTWKKGADMGPEAFLNASENMELYDIETGTEPYTHGIHLTDPLPVQETPELMVDLVDRETSKYIDQGKFVTLFGGEHSISIGSIRAFHRAIPKLTVLQIDAHADLRREYEGTNCNHACAVYEASQECNLVQVGIRSMDVSEVGVNQEDRIFYAHELSHGWQDRVVEKLGEHVFVTIDLDAFDPSICPGTGTPEPGGLQWYDTLELLRKVAEQREIVGFDIVELLPLPDEGVSEFLAAKLYYKFLSYIFEGQ